LEKKNQNSTQLGLKDELTAIGDELRSLKLTPPREFSPMDLNFSFDRDNTRESPATTASLEARMRNLEARFDTLTGEYNDRTSALEKDLESSLVLSEKRVKKLDELYREASAENEALYDRFNTELSKIAKDVRSGHAEDALKSQLASALDEIGRVKKENFRLKREVGGLRAQSAAHALLKASEQ
jgi:BMFP domain-containing protein YqiC